MSEKTPIAVTSAPAPGPCTTSGVRALAKLSGVLQDVLKQELSGVILGEGLATADGVPGFETRRRRRGTALVECLLRRFGRLGERRLLGVEREDLASVLAAHVGTLTIARRGIVILEEPPTRSCLDGIRKTGDCNRSRARFRLHLPSSNETCSRRSRACQPCAPNLARTLRHLSKKSVRWLAPDFHCERDAPGSSFRRPLFEAHFACERKGTLGAFMQVDDHWKRRETGALSRSRRLRGKLESIRTRWEDGGTSGLVDFA